MKELLLSIIIPAYNAEKYILSCLESIYEQNLQEDEFEIILINDGSTDNTLSIVETFSKSHSNINIINQNNQGLSITRNNGMKNAKGKYILFVDSDDLLIKDSIRTMLNIAINYSLDILMAEVATIDDKNVQKGNIPNCSTLKSSFIITTGKDGFLEYYNSDESYVFKNLFKRSFLEQKELLFLENVYFEDVAFTIHSYLKAERFMAIDYVHYIYRRNETSIMSTMNTKKLKDMNTIINYLIQLNKEYLLSNDVSKKLQETIFACFSVVMWYLSHYTSLYPQRKEVIADLKKKCPNLSFNDNMKQRITTLFYKYMPSVYISFRYLTAKRKYNQ